MSYGGDPIKPDKVDEALNPLLIAFAKAEFRGCNDFEARQIKNVVRGLIAEERELTEFMVKETDDRS